MKLDPLRLKAWDATGNEINITLSEWRIILILWMADRRLSMDELCRLLYECSDRSLARNLISVHIGRIRRKLGHTVITGKAGYGYIWHKLEAA